MTKYAIGLDFGTLSVRALLLNIETGEEVKISVFEYPHGVMGTMLPCGKQIPANGALQHPGDYIEGLKHTVKDIMEGGGILPEEVVGIGIDFTASTILPTLADGRPLCFLEEFEKEPHAYVKLWKHHGGEAQAVYIDEIAKKRGEKWPHLYGGKISGEWMLPKVLETLQCAPKVYDKADRFIEAMDWIVWQMTAEETRSVSGLRYKAFYNHETGHPLREFLAALDGRLENFIADKMEAPIKEIGEMAGCLSESMAHELGLLPGTPVGTPMIDAHAGVLGGGVTKPGEMMIIVGTSFCHLLLLEKQADVKGICSLVKDGILPGYFAYEAGQSGGGDHFAWFTKNCVPESYELEARDKHMSIHQLLCKKLEGYQAGQSGLLALDWFNGVRSPLTDFNLNGLIMGMNLQTKPEEIYLALIEATAYGTRVIIEEFEKAGVAIDSIVLSGGIPMKNPMLVQVYADILNRQISVCKTAQAGAAGAAMLGTAAAPSAVTGYRNLVEIVEKLGKRGDKIYVPNPNNREAYDQLFEEYKTLLSYFGEGANDVMKRLNRMRSDKS